MVSWLRPALGFVVLLAGALVAPRTVDASPPRSPTSLTPVPSTPQISVGEDVVECGWPSVVAVSSGGLCTGTLIHPRVVVYAAHCGGANKTVRFGESTSAGGREVEVERCRAYPGYAGTNDQGHDWAYCLLAEPVDDLAIAPPLYGCERDRLAVGEEVAIVGYGQSLTEASGTKRWAATSLAAVTPSKNTTLVGDPNLGLPSFCPGDSGGPALIELEDGSWRTFGIASTVAGECGGYGAHSTLSGAVPWIEQDTGVDVTPCHTQDGAWAPGPACAGMLAASPNVGAGSWADWCAGVTTSAASTSCGPAWDSYDASALPTVAIRSPTNFQTFLNGVEVHVEVDAVKHPEGFALASVSLRVDGEELAVDEVDPWEFFGPPFPGPGVYELVAVARDWTGNEVESEPVLIGWGETEFPDPSATEGGDSESGDSSNTSETDGSERPTPSDGGGCSLRDRHVLPGWGFAVLVLVQITRRPRR